MVMAKQSIRSLRKCEEDEEEAIGKGKKRRQRIMGSERFDLLALIYGRFWKREKVKREAERESKGQ